ncbi:MAG: hypothetical protein AAB906_03305 [Patescibacteria group bacterium]
MEAVWKRVEVTGKVEFRCSACRHNCRFSITETEERGFKPGWAPKCPQKETEEKTNDLLNA